MNKHRHALVLCGGKGTRFRKISLLPKILAPFRDALFIDWMIKYLRNNQFNQITFSVCYKSEKIISHLQEHYKTPEIDFINEPQPLGTGGACQYFFSQIPVDEVTVLNGDTYLSDDIPYDFFRSKEKITCLITSIGENDRYGDFSLDNGKLLIKRGTDTDIIKNSNIFTGIIKLNSKINFNELHPPFSLENLLEKNAYVVKLINYSGKIIDFGIPSDYKKMIIQESQ